MIATNDYQGSLATPQLIGYRRFQIVRGFDNTSLCLIKVISRPAHRLIRKNTPSDIYLIVVFACLIVRHISSYPTISFSHSKCLSLVFKTQHKAISRLSSMTGAIRSFWVFYGPYREFIHISTDVRTSFIKSYQASIILW